MKPQYILTEFAAAVDLLVRKEKGKQIKFKAVQEKQQSTPKKEDSDLLSEESEIDTAN